MCRRQRLRSSVARESDVRFRATSVDLLQSAASQKYSVESTGSRFPGGGGGPYGGDSMSYQAGGGSTENEYAYVWETLPQDDVVVGARRLQEYPADTMIHHVQHYPSSSSQKPRGQFSRQTSLAPSGEYETTATATPNSAGVMQQAEL